jgi:hypothetical protein
MLARHAYCHAVCESQCRGGRHRPAFGARAQSNRDIEVFDFVNRGEQLVRVGRNADDKITVERGRIFQAAVGGESDGLLFRLVEVAAVLDQLGA